MSEENPDNRPPPQQQQQPSLPPQWPSQEALHGRGGESGGRGMEINNHFEHRRHKELGSPLYMPPGGGEVPGGGGGGLDPSIHHLESYYRLRKDALERQFETHRMMLAHEQQVAMYANQQQQALEQQKKLEQEQMEQQEHLKQHKIAELKHKKKADESAVASNEVKQKLRECLLNKNKHSPPDYRHWSKQHSSLEQNSPPASGLSPPLRGHLNMARYDDEYPLRKTVSEPNLKMRSKILLRQMQRNSPLVTRREAAAAFKKKNPLTIDTTLSSSNPDSGPNSPPSGTSHGSQGSVGETPPLPKEGETLSNSAGSNTGNKTFPLELMSKMVINQSMPNISLGQQQPLGGDGGPLSEAEMRARMAVHHGMPLTQHMMTGQLPYYPLPHSQHPPPGMDGGGIDPVYLESQMKALELARSTGQIPQMAPVSMQSPGAGAGTSPYSVSAAAAAAAAAAMSDPRLKRTHSEPLPLPPLMLQHQLLLQQHKQQEHMLKENQKHYLLKQRLASSIMARSGSKNHMENVDEEVEARLVQEMRGGEEEEDPMVTEQKPRRTMDNRETFLLKIRQRALQAESPPSAASATAMSMSATVSPVSSGTKLLVHANSSPAQFSLPHTAGHPATATGSLSSASASASASLDDEDDDEGSADSTTGLAYDPVMLQHTCLCGGDEATHPENPGRMHAIYCRLHDTGLLNACQRVQSRKARLEELQSCHSEAYTLLYGSNPKKLADPKLDPNIFEPLIQRFCKLPCGGIGVDSDTVWNEAKSPVAARVAAGCVIEIAFKVATEQLRNGFALVRPPGHHAEPTQAMGFCFFNSIAVATKQLLDKLKLKKVLILDWDVHHGNSTQQIFYADPRVLYISLHRHDNGNFFPGTGAPEECGIDRGTGFNVNVAWSGGLSPPMSDADYLAAFRSIVMPIAREFGPEMVLVSAGFDGAAGHPAPLGGYNITPECFGYLTKQVMSLAGGKVVLALEGGYVLKPVCDSTEMCIRTLLGQEIPQMKEEELLRAPCQNALATLRQTMEIQAHYWPCLRAHLPTMHLSAIAASQRSVGPGEDTETVTAFASLSVLPEKPKGEEESDMSTRPAEPMEQS